MISSFRVRSPNHLLNFPKERKVYLTVMDNAYFICLLYAKLNSFKIFWLGRCNDGRKLLLVFWWLHYSASEEHGARAGLTLPRGAQIGFQHGTRRRTDGCGEVSKQPMVQPGLRQLCLSEHRHPARP